MVHYLTGFNKHEENLTLCGRPGQAANFRSGVTCEKCLVKLPPEEEPDEKSDNNKTDATAHWQSYCRSYERTHPGGTLFGHDKMLYMAGWQAASTLVL